MGWLERADQYFTINKTPLEMKVSLALVCMEGDFILDEVVVIKFSKYDMGTTFLRASSKIWVGFYDESL